MTSRANLKMQLQRDQLLQEDRQRRNTASPFSNNGVNKNNSSAINFPNTPGSFNATTELPAKVLKVETRLQNPTNYHVKETQKAQVREYISQSHTNDAGSKYLNKSSFLHPTRSSAPTGGIAQELQQQHGSTPASPMAQLTLSTADNEMHDIIDNIVSLESSYGDESHLHQYSKSTNIRTISPTPLGAFSLQNNLPPGVAEKTSTSCPVKREITKEERAIFDKDRQKKDNHNIIERRRRYNINDRIRELGHMVPKSNDPDIRWNKGTILKAAVDYIHDLEGERKRQKQAEQQARQMAEMNKKLLLRIQQLEMQVGAGQSPQGSVGTTSQSQTFDDGETKQMVDTLLNYGSYEAKPTFTQQDEMDVARFPDNMVTIPDNRLSSPPHQQQQNFTPVLGVSPHVGSPQIPLIAKVEPSEMDVMPVPVTSHYPTSSPQNTFTTMQLGIQQQPQQQISPGYHQQQSPFMQQTSPNMVATSPHPHHHQQMGGVSPHPHHQQQMHNTQDNIVLPSIDDFSMGNTEPGRFTALLTDNQYDDTVMDDIIKDDIFLSDATKLG